MKFIQDLLKESRQKRLKRTRLGQKHKRAERIAKKQQEKEVTENESESIWDGACRILDEDWGSSDQGHANRSFIRDLEHEKGVDGMMNAAYELANFHNDERQYAGDEWSHFSPMSLIQRAIGHPDFPKDRLKDAQDIIDGNMYREFT